MSDLISRQAAIDALNDEFTIIGKTNAIVVQDYIRRVNNRLHDLPSAQPDNECEKCIFKPFKQFQPERKKGNWIKISPANIYECSECGKNVMTDDISAYDFCHGCGADMRGESE